jgi:hypothetical protein
MEGRPAAPIDASTGEWHKGDIRRTYGWTWHWQAKVKQKLVRRAQDIT